MNSYQIFESIVIAALVAAQVYLFLKTRTQILLLRGIFPGVNRFAVADYVFVKTDLSLHPQKILDDLDLYIERAKDPEIAEGGLANVELLIKRGRPHRVTDLIISSINIYLLRNKGAASDYHLIRDIVESNCEVVEDEISQEISLPLYLGLLGTFLGIVMGLFQISGYNFSANSDVLNEAITTLLGGVKIAMIASFFGLLATVVNTAVNLNPARSTLQKNKNAFYTFIKTDLLPLLNQNINSTLYSLQNNLHKFNEEFKDNVSKLSGVMGKNYDSLMAQEKILTSLDNLNITEFAKANVIVLKELKISTAKLTGLSQYIGSLEEMISSTQNLTGTVSNLVGNTDDLAHLGARINDSFEENKRLQLFLQNHYSSLDQSHDLISQSVNKVNQTLDDSLDNLKIFTQDKIEEIKKISIREVEIMENQYAGKWQNLDHLPHLQTLSQDIKEIKNNEFHASEMLNRSMAEFQGLLRGLKDTVQKIEAQQKENMLTRSWKWITKKDIHENR